MSSVAGKVRSTDDWLPMEQPGDDVGIDSTYPLHSVFQVGNRVERKSSQMRVVSNSGPQSNEESIRGEISVHRRLIWEFVGGLIGAHNLCPEFSPKPLNT